jgi:predicted DNA-binding protein (UPF0251 family)
MDEQWRPAPGHPDHLVSSLGRVRHRRVNAAILKGYTDADGYRRVRIDNKERRVHRLVCEAFHGPPPPGTECAHGDGDALNNDADNLRWALHADNIADAIRHGTFHFVPVRSGEDHPNVKLSDKEVAEIRAMVAAGKSQRAVAAAMGVSQPYVSRLMNTRRPKDIAKDMSHD